MGWLVVIALPQVVDAVGPRGMAWLVAGGLSYTIGAGFYAAKRVTFGPRRHLARTPGIARNAGHGLTRTLHAIRAAQLVSPGAARVVCRGKARRPGPAVRK